MGLWLIIKSKTKYRRITSKLYLVCLKFYYATQLIQAEPLWLERLLKMFLSKDFAVTMKNASDTVLHDADNCDVIILVRQPGITKVRGNAARNDGDVLLNKWQGIFAENDLQVYGCGDKMFVEFCAAVDYMESLLQMLPGLFYLH